MKYEVTSLHIVCDIEITAMIRQFCKIFVTISYCKNFIQNTTIPDAFCTTSGFISDLYTMHFLCYFDCK